MGKNLVKLAQEIDNLVKKLVSMAQIIPKASKPSKPKDEPFQYGKSIKEVLISEYEEAIVNDAKRILQKISDDIWNKSNGKETFGYYKIDVNVSVANGNVSMGFVLSPNLSDNKDNNQMFARALNKTLMLKYNGQMTKTVKALEGGKNVTSKFNLIQISGSVN